MFTVEKVSTFKVANVNENNKATDLRKECESIMNTIYNENPSYWPHGLTIDAHDGGVYMIREASTKKPVGFTGWQERMDGNIKVGFYSIGILPEYRNNGYAKQAVSKLIALKSANVDKVKALVMKHNTPSLHLAESLNIPAVKVGSYNKSSSAKDLLKMLLMGGVPAAAGMDALTYGRDKSFEDYKNTPMSISRGVQILANTLFGSLSARPNAHIAERMAVLAGIPAKDVALSAIPAIPSLSESIKDISSNKSVSLVDFVKELSPSTKALGAGLGTAGILGGGYMAYKGINALKDLATAQQQSNRGRVRVALPTKDPEDQETTIEMPIEDLAVARSQFEKLQRDLRRRIRKETKTRTTQRTISSLMTPKEATSKSANVSNVKALLNILYA